MGETIKEPAFLLYSSDFLVDTLLWGDIEVGRYIKLICLLHQKGHLSKEDVLSIVKDEKSIVFSKLQIDEKGLYYNAKMDDIFQKRKSYCESRRRNRNSVSKTYVEHMENENVIENINRIVIENNYSNLLENTLISWLDYKLERKELYKQQGFKSFLTQIQNKISEFGESPVIEAIENSKAQNYKGIIYPKKVIGSSYQTRKTAEQEQAKREFLGETVD